MFRRVVRPALAALAAAAMTVTVTAAAGGLAAPPNPDAGPPYEYTTELMGQFRFIPLKDQAMLTRTEHGYRFRTGQQDSHLVMTRTRRGGLRLVDTGTARFKKLSPACRRQQVRRGIAAVCPVPGSVTASRPLLVEVWPRLGDDFTDGSSLPATFALAVLGDEGHDVTRLGAGPDFFNGHSGRDPVSAGAGDDWVRGGLGNDTFRGGLGADDLVGMEGGDTVYGGRGGDRLVGMDGDDRLYGGAGEDLAVCGTGRDRAWLDQGDRALRDCEYVGRG